jgi:hypothetical protein
MLNYLKVRNEIVQCISHSGIGFSSWHIGIASDPMAWQFTDKKIGNDTYLIFKDAGSDEFARLVVKFLVDTYGAVGDAGDGDETCRYVYAYASSSKIIE